MTDAEYIRNSRKLLKKAKTDGNTLLAEVKTAKDKCIGKWEKRLQKAKEQKQRWGDSYWNNYTERITTYEEIIADLKRV